MGFSKSAIIIVGIYLLFMLFTGWIGHKGNRSTTDFLVAGRSLGLISMIATMATFQIGTGIILSSANNGYAYVFWPGSYFSLGCGCGLIVTALVSRRLRKKEGFVPMDFFAERYGESKGVRLWSWASNIPSLLGLFISQILSCGVILEIFGIPFWMGCLICSAVVLIYCYMGGMKGTAITNIIQIIIILIGIPVLFFTALARYKMAGFTAGEAFGNPFIPSGMETRFVYLFLPYLFSLSVCYDSYTRIQSAKNDKVAFWGSVGGGIIVMVVGMMCSGIGVMIHKLFQGAENNAFITATFRCLPSIGAGVVIASVLSAAMSTANCVILTLSSTVCRDFYNKVLHTETDELDALPKARIISRATIVIGIIIGFIGCLYVTDILDAIIIFNYPFSASMLVPLLGGLIWKGGTQKGAYAAMVVGGILGVAAFISGIPGPFHGMINTDLALLFSYMPSAIVYVIVSLRGR